MKKIILILSAFSFALLLANEGQELHQESCLSCHIIKHDKKFYSSRVNKKIKTLASLKTQVKRCSSSQGAGWFPEEETAVAKWLNDSYYHLK